jgi:hypothetical protein
MPINRRTAIQQVFFVAGGVIFLPACFHHKDKSTLALHHIRLDGDQQETLAALADALLPAGSSPSDRHPGLQPPSDRHPNPPPPSDRHPNPPPPSDQTLGAKAVGAHLFALKMIDDCYPDIQQQQFMRGLKAFDEQARHQYGKSFANCDQKQRDDLVAAINASAAATSAAPPSTSASEKTTDLFFFFRENKSLVIRGYLGSQYFLTKIEVYELVPGRWHGCTPVIKKS